MEKPKRSQIAFAISTLIYGVFFLGFLLFSKELTKPITNQKESVKVSISNNLPTPTKQNKPKETKKIENTKPIQEQNQQISAKKEIIKEAQNKEIVTQKVEPTQTIEQPIKQIIEAKKEAKAESITAQKIAIPIETTKIIPKLMPQNVEKTVEQKPIQKQQITDNKEKKERYFTLIKQSIEKRKSYPSNALRRGIEGEMTVRFTVSPNGELVSILSIDGNTIFKASIKEALENSFPIAPPTNLFYENTTMTLQIGYKIQT
jgi:TonB family protein